MRSAIQLIAKYRGKKAMVRVFHHARNQRRPGDKPPYERATGIEVPVIIHDAKTAYGREMVLVQSPGGTGSAWIGIGCVRLVKEWPNGSIESDDKSGPGAGGDQLPTPTL